MAARFVNGAHWEISNVALSPTALAKSLLSKIAAKQCHQGNLPRFRYDTRYVISIRLLGNVSNPAVNPRGPYNLALFPKVNGGHRQGDFIAGTGLDLDERQREGPCGLVISNDVDFARDLASGPAMTNWSPEIR